MIICINSYVYILDLISPKYLTDLDKNEEKTTDDLFWKFEKLCG